MQVCGCSGVVGRNPDFHTDRLHTQVNEVVWSIGYAPGLHVDLKPDAVIKKSALGPEIKFLRIAIYDI